MLDSFIKLMPWLATLPLLPKIVISGIIILLAIFLLALIWSSSPTEEKKTTKEAQIKQSEIEYSIQVTSFKESESIEQRMAIVAAIVSTGLKVRDDGKAWSTPQEAWDSWYSSVYPKLSPSVVDETDVFVLHRGSPEQGALVIEAINGIFPEAEVKLLRHGASKTQYISVYVTGKRVERFKVK